MHKLWVGVGFLTGVVTGFLASKQYFEVRYRQMAEDEIDSVKEAFRNDRPEPIRKKKTDSPEVASEDAVPIKYTNYKDAYKGKKSKYRTETENLAKGEVPVIAGTEPVVIPPELFGDNEDYETISLTYYADGVLAGDDNKPMTVDEIRQTVGTDSLTRFGEYEDDSVFVRNDALQCEYEILLNHHTYRDMMKTMPPDEQEG